MPKTNAGDERVIMKVTGMLVDLLVQLSPNTYGSHVVFENGKKDDIPTGSSGTIWDAGSGYTVVSEVAKRFGIYRIQNQSV